MHSDHAALFAILRAVSDEGEDVDRVFVGTIHSAKGLEWDSVVVMGWEDGILPQRQSESFRALEEERRIAYVGITRSKNFLMLTDVKEREGREYKVSPFLSDIFDEDVYEHNEDPDDAETPNPILPSSSGQFAGTYSNRDMSKQEYAEWGRHLRKLRLSAEKVAKSRIADGASGDSSGWSDQAAGTGLLAEAGYTVKKDGPSAETRHSVLTDVLQGKIQVPDWMSQSVQDQWGEPNTLERFTKLRNTINVSLGNQQGRAAPSAQAIDKWEEDLAFLDTELRVQLLEVTAKVTN